MAQEKKYIPELRFPEFKNDGEWILETIGTIADTFSGGTPTVGNREYYGGDIPFIRSGEISNDKTELFITESGLSNSSAKMVDKGTILYAMYGATSGEVAISKISGAINQAILAIIPRKQEYNSRYIYHYLKHNKQYILSKYLQGGQGNLSANIINNLPIYLPCDSEGKVSIKEQQKIADCLSSLDEYINVAKQKVDQLKEHKKGLMQRLFLTKGKTTPEFRFSEFLYDGEWDSCPVAKIFDRVTRKNKGRSQNVLTISSRYGLVSQFEYFNRNVAAADLANYYLIEEGDFAYNKSRSQGYPYGVIRSLKSCKEGVVSPIYLCFRLKDYAKHNNDYFEYLFDSDVMSSEIGKVAQEGARNHGLLNIPTDNFFNIIFVVIPPSKEEQDKIALCLSSLNKLILAYEKSVSIMEQHKKALMHQLFPEF